MGIWETRARYWQFKDGTREGSQLAQAPHSCVLNALDHMDRHCFVDKDLTFMHFKGGLPAPPFTALFST